MEPCPEHGGKHPLHDHRIVSSPGGWVCVMRDQQAQEADANLIAAAPALLEALQAFVDSFDKDLSALAVAKLRAEHAIRLATGEVTDG